MASNRNARNPNLLFPGCLTQVPPSTARDTYRRLQHNLSHINQLQQDKLDKNGALTASGSMAVNGSLTVDHDLLIDGSGTILRQFTIGASGQVASSGAASGNLTVWGFAGIGVSPAHRFHVQDAPVEFFFDRTRHPGSALRGFTINKMVAADPNPHGIDWAVSGSTKWGMGQDFDTAGGGGDSDFIPCFDYTTPNGNGGFGADILRFSPWSASSQGLKVNLGAPAGSPKDNPAFFRVTAQPNLAPLQIDVSAGSTVDTLRLFQQQTHNAIRINYNDHWIHGLDIGAASTNDLTWYDGASGKTTRLFLKGSTDKTSRLGVGTTNPQGIVSADASADSSLYETPQIYFLGSYTDDQTRHSLSLATILNASFAHNYLMLQGAISGSVAAPVLVSTFGGSFGMESTDNTLSLITAAQGVGLTPIRGLSMDVSGNLQAAAAFTASGQITGAGQLQLWGYANLLNNLTVSGTVLMAGAVGIGGPVDASTQLTVRGQSGWGVLNLYGNGGAAVNICSLSQQVANTNTLRWNWNGQWVQGLDINATGSRDWFWYDSVQNTTRLYLAGTTDKTSRLGVGTTSPQGIVAISSSSDSSLYDTPQTYLCCHWADSRQNRAINLSTIINGSTASNYVMLNGTVSGTVASPTLTSSFASSFGIESKDSSLSLITAAAGTGLTPIRALTVSNVGAVQVSGALTAAAALQVWGPLTAQSTLTASGQITGAGALQVWGAASLLNNLVVQGSTNLNGLTAGATLLNSLTVTGAVIIQGGLSVTGHLIASGGKAPTAASGSASAGATLSVISGSNDTRGEIDFTVGASPSGGQMIKVTFASAYSSTPYVFVQALDFAGGSLGYSIGDRNTSGFSIYCQTAPTGAASYKIYYWILG